MNGSRDSIHEWNMIYIKGYDMKINGIAEGHISV